MKSNKHRIYGYLKRRAQVIQAVRQFFLDKDFLEVETPCRVPAPAPEAHINAVSSEEWFLHTSPELCMKRLLCAGFPRIFQICKCFRKKERGPRHLPEFTMLEWYCAGASYKDMMDQCEALIRFVSRRLSLGESFVYQGKPLHLEPPWDRWAVSDAFEKFASISLSEALLQDRFNESIAFELEPRLGFGRPVFLYDYPASHRAFSKLKPENSVLAERFELYIHGLEICNAFSEITDPEEQRSRFDEELKFRKLSGEKVYPLPENFLHDLKDMPEAAGNALGIDRLVMVFADASKIDDVVTFTPEEL